MKYKSCNLIQHGLCFFDHVLVSCCFSPNDQVNGGHPPIIREPYNGEILSKEDLFKRINEYDDIFKRNDCPLECINCYHIEEKDWDNGEYINSITISHFSVCQADCIYCSNNLEHNNRTNEVYEILPLLRTYKEQGIIRKGVELHIGGGEFTIYKECDELLDEFALSGFAKVYIPTNAIKYSEKLALSIQANAVKIIVSLDSGCRETYKKIKRVDKFNDVVENLKKYASKDVPLGGISIKYIVIPSVNDSYEEFKKFLKVVKYIGAKHIIIDVDARYARSLEHDVDEYLIYFAKNLEKMAKDNGFSTELYSFLQQCEEVTASASVFSLLKSYVKYRYFNKSAKFLYGNIK